jgi:hypothetical protein
MELFGGSGDRPIIVDRGQRAQLADCQLPQESACHCHHHYNENFAPPKDIKIVLIPQIALP